MPNDTYVNIPGEEGMGGGVTSLNSETGDINIVAGSNITVTPSGQNITIAATGGGGSGTVTSVSVISAHGLAGTVATATTTPAITLSTSVTGIVKGDGTSLSAATAGTDYSVGTSALSTGILKSTTSTGALTTAIAADFPTLNQNTTGTAANVTGTVIVANGGTGDTTFTAYAPILAGTTSTGTFQQATSGMSNSGYVLTSTGTSSSPTWQASGGSTTFPLAAPTSATSAPAEYSFTGFTSDGFGYDPSGPSSGYGLFARINNTLLANFDTNGFHTLNSTSISSAGDLTAASYVSGPAGFYISQPNGAKTYGRFLWMSESSSLLGGLGFNTVNSPFRVNQAFFQFQDFGTTYDGSNQWEGIDLNWNSTTGTTTIIPQADAVASAVTGLSIILSGGNKTAGTGAGGNLTLSGGTSSGGTAGIVQVQASDLSFITAGDTISTTEAGSGADVSGSGTLSGGTVTITTSAATTTSRILLQNTDTGSLTNVGTLIVSTKSTGSFVVTSTNPLDTSTFDWFIIHTG